MSGDPPPGRTGRYAALTPTQPPDVLTAWLSDEWEYCLSVVPYGAGLRDAWGSSSIHEVGTLLIQNLPPESRAWSAPFVASLRGSDACIPGYQGIIERSLRLVQTADEAQNGDFVSKIVAATLPTNQRFAAVYVPHVATDWNVIAIDWGLLCGLLSLAVCFARIAPVEYEAGGDLVIRVGWETLTNAVASESEIVAELVSKAMLPCMLMDTEPPLPLPMGPDRSSLGLTGLLLNSLVYSVVAHEYAHVRLGHLSEIDASPERRHQMEFEADATALAYIMTNPWRNLFGLSNDHSFCFMAAAAHALVLSFIGMLEVGDRMLTDLGYCRRKHQTHPPALARMGATQYILNEVLNLDQDVKQLLNQYRGGFCHFGDEIWNKSVDSILRHLQQRRPPRCARKTVRLRRADLKFF